MKARSLIALLLILTLLLVGCGTPQRQGGTIRPVEDDHVQDTAGQNEDPTEDSMVETTGQDKQLALGTYEGGIYENTYVGYGCTLGDGWVYQSAEEIQNRSDLIKAMLEGSEVDQMGGSFSHVTDMIAENSELLTTINVQYTQLTLQQQLSQALLTDEDMIDSIIDMKDAMISSYAQAGIEVYSMEKVTVNFLGEERSAVYTVASIGDISYYILQLVDMNLGPYYVTLTLGSFLEDKTTDMLDLFFVVE